MLVPQNPEKALRHLSAVIAALKLLLDQGGSFPPLDTRYPTFLQNFWLDAFDGVNEW